METDTSQTNFDPSAQENWLSLGQGVISPIFSKNNHGIRVRDFLQEINGGELRLLEKQFQKTVGRILMMKLSRNRKEI